jgi:integrase
MQYKGVAMARRAASIERLSSVKVDSHVVKEVKPLHDGGGLYIRRFGAANWFWYLRATSPVTGKQTWAAIRPGIPYPRTTLAIARTEARSMREQLSKGDDATKQRQQNIARQRAVIVETAEAKKRAVTLRAVFAQWRETALTPRQRTDGKRIGRKDGGQYVEEQFERHVFPALGTIAIVNIRKPDVFEILDRLVADNKLRTANMVLSDLKQLFRFAAEREIIIANPIETIKKERVGGTDTERARALSESEISALPSLMLNARLTKPTERAAWIILATGARVGELMGAAWGEHPSKAAQLNAIADDAGVKYGTVNLLTRQWHMADTKNQRAHTIHLSDFAVEQFKALTELRTHDDWIFPDQSNTKPVCVKSFGKQIADRQRATGKAMKNRSAATTALMLPGGKWTAHDLRRTAATLMGSMGVSNDVINECLNHKQNDRMTRVYVRDRREAEQAIAFDKLGSKLAALITGAPQSNVVKLPTKKRA